MTLVQKFQYVLKWDARQVKKLRPNFVSNGSREKWWHCIPNLTDRVTRSS